MSIHRIRTLCAVAVIGGGLSGCAALDASINHANLDVQTHMSESVFLDPVPPNARTIFVSARNTSDHPEIDLRGSLTQAMAARGYQVVEDPNLAHYMLRVNILYAGPIETKDTNSLLMGKYGEPLLAGAGAAALTAGLGGGVGTTAGVGLGVAAASYLANQLIKDVTYSVVVDIQLSERPLSGAKVRQSTSTLNAQGNANTFAAKSSQVPTGKGYTGSAGANARVKAQEIDEQVDFKQYQIRALSYANKVNLKFEEAVPTLLVRLTSSLSNLFE
ncbi:MAG: hypothetical protein RLZZ501_1169 [Pseudomonadota bacterium]|jgi:hypothetical protein